MSTTIQQRYDDLIDIAATGTSARATYRHGPALPKPCVHPITTPAGACLTGFEMSDHVWHRGLWFTVKFINGENFWEENAPCGVQTSAGQPAVTFAGPDVARIEHALDWTSDKTGLVIRERRTLEVTQRDAVTTIDWTSDLHPEQDLLLDRTPYTTWGGYTGLTFRAAREVHGASFIVPGGSSVPQLLGDRHEWALLQGKVDGGTDRKIAVGIIDHPANPRGPTPWYGKSADGYVFFNAAFLFHEPMSVRKGDALTFRYRVLCRDGHWTAEEFESLAADFRGGSQ